MENKAYKGIDYFRILAALLIITIHTSPMLTYSEMGDFILTRIIARIAVPFFLMTSGFFLISKYNCNSKKLKKFVRETLMIYAIAIVIYIPVNIYNGYFSMENLLPNIVKDLIFDGTMYHLWYLPASAIGAVIAWKLVEKAGMKKAFGVTCILYIIGMFGDSYYGLAEKIPMIKSVYGYIFQISDYTRNGIFFTPVFFILGGMIADQVHGIDLKEKTSKGQERLFWRKSLCGFGISLGIMLCEGVVLHRFGLQKHDSMYIMLIPCMFFLFNILIRWRGERNKSLRSVALVIYIIHPMIIIVVRMAAKLLNMQTLLVENSLVHYCAVTIISVVISIGIVKFYEWIKGHYTENKHKEDERERWDNDKKQHGNDRAWTEINFDHLKHNVETLQKAMPKDCELMAVVKADAYGHGSERISAYVNQMGVKAFAVATIDEAIKLRNDGIQGEILILGYTNPERAKELHKFQLTQTLVSHEYAIALSHQGYKIKSHIGVNTGMNRMGFDAEDVKGISEIYAKKQLGVCGIYTHLCVADSLLPEDVEFTHKQINKFYNLMDKLAQKGIHPPKIHIQSSYGLLNYPELKCNYVRAGIALYGLLSSPDDETKLKLDLRPVLSLKTKVVLIRKVKKGETVGYGRTFTADRDSRLAILSIGYADGVPRNLSGGKGSVLINGYEVPIVGRVCMDQLTVDITDVKDIAVGDIATVIGCDGTKELSAPSMANSSGSISNELLSRMGGRLKVAGI